MESFTFTVEDFETERVEKVFRIKLKFTYDKEQRLKGFNQRFFETLLTGIIKDRFYRQDTDIFDLSIQNKRNK